MSCNTSCGLSERTRRLMTYFGMFVNNFVCGVPLYYGNLLTYTDSYFLVRQEADISNLSAYTLATWNIVWVASIAASDKVFKGLRLPHILLVSISFNVAGACSGYWTVRSSTVAFLLCQGVLPGIGTGVGYALMARYLLAWTKGRSLGAWGSFTTTTSLGSVAVNQLITSYINPSNLPPDLPSAHTNYFSRKEILDRVPSAFLVLSATMLAFQMTAFCLMSEPREEDEETVTNAKNVAQQKNSEPAREDEKERMSHTPRGFIKGCENYKDIEVGNGKKDVNHFPPLLKADGSHDLSSKGNGVPYSEETVQDDKHNGKGSFGQNSYSQSSDKTVVKKEDQINMRMSEGSNPSLSRKDEDDSRTVTSPEEHGSVTVSEALRMKEFYILWLGVGSIECLYVTQDAFYKIFGQSVIKDDHFLTAVGITLCIFVFLMRLVWGATVDKLGAKISMLLVCGACSITSTLWYFTPYASRWLYLIWTCLVGGATCGMYGVMFVSAYQCFGSKHFTTIYGLILTSGICASLFVAWTSGYLLDAFGWFGLFNAMALVNLITVIVTLILFPYKIQ